MTTATIDLPRHRAATRRQAQPSQRGTALREWLTATPEITLIGVVWAGIYVVAGWVMRYHFGYAVNDALARSSKAVYMAASRDPHFGAVGFYWPPLPSTIQIPFVLALKSSGRMDFAGPLSTALLTG